MSGMRIHSDPDLAPGPAASKQQYDDSALQGVAANIKLLLKLIQDHKDACDKENTDRRRMLRVATMITILDNVRARIQKCQSFGNKRSAELRRCNTDLRPSHNTREKRPGALEPVLDEKERLRRELSASLASHKSLEIMCSSLGREKEIMASELSRKVQQLSGMEEHINDLKEQNRLLLEKLQTCKKHAGDSEGESESAAHLQEQNKILSEQLLRSLRGNKLMKRKLKEVEKENTIIRSAMEAKVVKGLGRVQSFKENLTLYWGSNPLPHVDVKEEVVAMENMIDRI